MIPLNLKFNAAQTLCGNLLFILPSITIVPIGDEERMMLEFEALWVANCTDYAQIYINDINIDADTSKFMKNDYLFTPEGGEKFLYAPISFIRIDPKWVAPNFERLRQQAGVML
jgi:hypothetical protein